MSQREKSKKERIRKQIDANASRETTRAKLNGIEFEARAITRIDQYPLTCMAMRDQLVQAIDRIEISDFKATLTPHERENGDLESPYVDEEYNEYTATFSLNDGDVNAFKKLIEACRNDENAMLFVPLEDETLWQKGNKLLLRSWTTNNEAGFVFELFDGGTMTDMSNAPTASAAMIIDVLTDTNGNIVTKEWNYRLTFMTKIHAKPKDAELKHVYGNMRDMIRSATASIGIEPTRASL